MWETKTLINDLPSLPGAIACATERIVTSISSPWWFGVTSALIGAGVGSSIPILSARRRRRVERRGEITAMISENYQARLQMRALISQNIGAPLYRLPTSISKQALPKLIGDGLLHAPEIDVLVEYVNRIDELNRGLERAGDAHAAQLAGSKWLEQEHSRNVAKAAEICEKASDDRFNGMTIIDAADACLHRMDSAHRTWWRRIPIRILKCGPRLS